MAVDPDVVNAALTDLVANPKSVTTDNGSFTEHGLAELDDLARKAAADDAVSANPKTRGIRFNKFDHRGTQG